ASGPAVGGVIDEDSELTAAGDDDPPARIERHAEDVIGELAVGELGDLEAERHAETELAILGSLPDAWNENEEQSRGKAGEAHGFSVSILLGGTDATKSGVILSGVRGALAAGADAVAHAIPVTG